MTIHLIAAGKYENPENWPPIWHQCFESLIKSKHDINIWDTKGIKKLIKEEDAEFYNEYLNKLDIIYQIDYVRYIILKKYGGAYMDMDVELVRDFFPLLNPNIIYMMEGTAGTYVENSIIISPTQDPNKTHEQKTHQERTFYEIWDRVKNMAKNNIIRRFKEIPTNKKLIIELIGPGMLSTFFSKIDNSPPRQKYNVLGYYQFSDVTSTLSFTKHYYSGVWCQMTEDVKKELEQL
jgi:mannosyltransferase OCH1-like enzyme